MAQTMAFTLTTAMTSRSMVQLLMRWLLYQRSYRDIQWRKDLGRFIWWTDRAPASQTRCLSTTLSTSTTTTTKVNNQKLSQKKNFVILHVLLTICLICQKLSAHLIGHHSVIIEIKMKLLLKSLVSFSSKALPFNILLGAHPRSQKNRTKNKWQIYFAQLIWCYGIKKS